MVVEVAVAHGHMLGEPVERIGGEVKFVGSE